ncbi:MAG: helix-turn-helix domain-containing protein [Alphaproteobacteria bacterium]
MGRIFYSPGALDDRLSIKGGFRFGRRTAGFGEEPLAVRLDDLPSIMSPTDAAKALSLSVNRLAKLRLFGGGPPFLKIGRSVRYTREGIAEWIASKTRCSTSDMGGAP